MANRKFTEQEMLTLINIGENQNGETEKEQNSD